MKNGYNEVVLENSTLYSNLRILKLDEEDDQKFLAGAHFRIKRLAGGPIPFDSYLQIKDVESGTGYVNGKTIAGVTQEDIKNKKLEILYTPEINDATEFVTPQNGQLYIGMVLAGTYEIEELSIDNSEYEINPNIETLVAEPSMTKEAWIAIRDKKSPPGGFELEKVDKDNHNTKLENVHFKFKRTGPDTGPTGWLRVLSQDGRFITDVSVAGVGIGEGCKFEYVDNPNDATEFVTNMFGMIRVSYIRPGDYQAVEVDNENEEYSIVGDTTIKFHVDEGSVKNPIKIVVENQKRNYESKTCQSG